MTVDIIYSVVCNMLTCNIILNVLSDQGPENSQAEFELGELRTFLFWV